MLFAFIIEAVEAKAKTRWYYNNFPKPISKGFTLAEILLTLTIIAVVASLTVLNLIQSEQQAQFNAGVWQADTMLSQAVETIQANNGYINVGNNNNSGMMNDFCSVMQCVRSDTAINILPPFYSNYKNSTSGWTIANAGTYNPSVVLNNGMYLFFQSLNCGSMASANVCGAITVDINGAQGPNMWGEDLYYFYIVLNNGIYSITPAGFPNDTHAGPGYTYQCVIGAYAEGCTYMRLFNPNGMP